MATVQQLLADINLRYRNTFTPAQKIVWMNEEQRELFDILQIEATPYLFVTEDAINFYPIPTGMEVEKIKTVSIQQDDSGNYVTLPFKSNDDNQAAGDGQMWYTIIAGSFYICIPGGVKGARSVYVYFDQLPVDINDNSLYVEPSVPVKYQELLKLGVLERIAAARKDIGMKNNFAAEKEQKIADVLWDMKMNEPEFSSAMNVLPRIRR